MKVWKKYITWKWTDWRFKKIPEKRWEEKIDPLGWPEVFGSKATFIGPLHIHYKLKWPNED